MLEEFALAAVAEKLSTTLPSASLERHYSPEELSQIWNLSADTVRRLFEREPGVLVIERSRSRARRYRTLRIPESVAQRVHRRLSNPANGSSSSRI
jgi:hypothetical protein